MSSRTSSQSKLARFAKAPIRALVKARDLYVRRMTQLSTSVVVRYCSGVMGGPMAHLSALQANSFSGNNSSRSSSASVEDEEELIRAASQRGLKNGQCSKPLVRSFTVGMERIDENKTCEFGAESLYLRSRSYSVSKKISENVGT